MLRLSVPAAAGERSLHRRVDALKHTLPRRQVQRPWRKVRPPGRGGRRPPPAFPQAKLCGLCEAGTHAVLNWGLKPAYWADCKMATPLLKRGLAAGQLLLWDGTFYSRENLAAVRAREAHVLGRL